MELISLQEKNDDFKVMTKIINDLKKRAEDGEFKSVMIITVRKDNDYETSWAGLGGLSGLERIGMLELLKKEALEDALRENNED